MSQSVQSIAVHASAAFVCAGLQAAQVGVEDVSRAYTLFLDVQRSTQYLVDNADQVRSCGDLCPAHP
jgi:DNA helicase TIP49 (TBP-interacting protein)